MTSHAVRGYPSAGSLYQSGDYPSSGPSPLDDAVLQMVKEIYSSTKKTEITLEDFVHSQKNLNRDLQSVSGLREPDKDLRAEGPSPTGPLGLRPSFDFALPEEFLAAMLDEEPNAGAALYADTALSLWTNAAMERRRAKDWAGEAKIWDQASCHPFRDTTTSFQLTVLTRRIECMLVSALFATPPPDPDTIQQAIDHLADFLKIDSFCFEICYSHFTALRKGSIGTQHPLYQKLVAAWKSQGKHRASAVALAFFALDIALASGSANDCRELHQYRRRIPLFLFDTIQYILTTKRNRKPAAPRPKLTPAAVDLSPWLFQWKAMLLPPSDEPNEPKPVDDAPVSECPPSWDDDCN